MASDLLLIVDDNSDEFKYSGSAWQISNLVQWYGGTSRSAKAGTGASAERGSFSINFEGKSIAFFGMTPAAPASQEISVSIDGGASFTTSYGDLTPPSYRQWYQSPDLAEGKHNITLGQIDGTSLDFAVITPYPDTPINDHRVVADDDNFTIRYSGAWRRNLNEFDAGTLPDGSPFHNGTHQTWNAGDSLSFSFTGSSIAVYGIFSWANLGLLKATYTLDGVSQSQSYSVTSSSPEFVNKIGQASNFLYYSSDSIAGGSHTLVINITHCTNQSFILDYITYLPSFTTLSQMPNYTTTTTTTSQKSSMAPVGTGRTSNPIKTPNNNEKSPHKISATTITGGILGGFIFFAIGGLLICWLCKRRGKKSHRRIGSDLYADPSTPLMQSSPTSLHRSMATRPISVNSHRSVSPFHDPHVPARPIRPDSAEGLKRHRQDEQREARRSHRPPVPVARTQSPPRSDQGRPTSSLDRPRGGFELYANRARDVVRQSTTTRNHYRESLSSGLLSPHLFVGPSRQPHLGLASTNSPDSDSSNAQQARHFTLPARDRIRIHGEASSAHGHEGRARSASDTLRNASPPRLAHTPLRLTPVRRGFSDSPTLSGRASILHGVDTPASHSAVFNAMELNSHPEGTDRQNLTMQFFTPVRASPRTASHDITEPSNALRETVRINAIAQTDNIQPSARPLTPVRRNITDPPLTAPVPTSTRSPLAAAFPRLSAILLRHSRSILQDIPRDVNEDEENWDRELAPPAYDSLSPQPLRSSSSNTPVSRPLPSPPTF
ncbi:hypothetical protein GALMADRAFT_136709 [Galerina marginata CBS 339.88]|uniref:Transmembrane protein n=1 Tax=Galerina marginata (strain CBS 339.88) TaxID=685588 RepID=A0A067TAD7_GALM3|nr:hypothetical protein GALMADRAFT_136709 [Galerina marginata CBS 339.88]